HLRVDQRQVLFGPRPRNLLQERIRGVVQAGQIPFDRIGYDLPHNSVYPVIPPRPYSTILAVVAAFVIATIAVRVVRGIGRRALEALEIVSTENHAAVQARANQLTSALTLLTYMVAAVASISLALERFGVTEPRWDPRELARWLIVHGLNI